MNLSVHNENAPVLHEWQVIGVVHERWHRLHYGLVVLMKIEYSPSVFLRVQVASRGSNTQPFIWYPWHLKPGHMVTGMVKVHVG